MTSSRPSASASRLYPPSIGHPGHLERREELGAEPLRLRQGAAGQLAAADAGGEPEVVLDARARPRLSAGRVAVEQKRPKPFRRAVHRGREAGGPRADDHEVVDVEGRRERPAEALGHLARLRVGQHAPVLEEQGRQRVGRDARRVEQRPRLGVPLDVEPAIRNEIARQEILDRVRSRRPLVSDQAQARRLRQGLGLPRVEQIVDHREEAFLGRIPWLRQVVIEMRLVDGPDRRFDVGVGGQQDAPRERVHLARPGEQLARRACRACAGR